MGCGCSGSAKKAAMDRSLAKATRPKREPRTGANGERGWYFTGPKRDKPLA